jgi:hypothetical protein
MMCVVLGELIQHYDFDGDEFRVAKQATIDAHMINSDDDDNNYNNNNNNNNNNVVASNDKQTTETEGEASELNDELNPTGDVVDRTLALLTHLVRRATDVEVQKYAIRVSRLFFYPIRIPLIVVVLVGNWICIYSTTIVVGQRSCYCMVIFLSFVSQHTYLSHNSNNNNNVGV